MPSVHVPCTHGVKRSHSLQVVVPGGHSPVSDLSQQVPSVRCWQTPLDRKVHPAHCSALSAYATPAQAATATASTATTIGEGAMLSKSTASTKPGAAATQ